MNSLLNKIEELKREINTYLPMNPEFQETLDKKFRLEFNYNSNHLEGNTLTYQDTELLLLFDDTKGGHKMQEYEEMKAHDVAFQLIKEWADDTQHILTEHDIKNLNKIILVRSYWKEAITPDGQATRRLISVGNYKEHPNSVRMANGQMHHYASPTDTPILMQELMDWYREETRKDDTDPIGLAAMLHYKFVSIHPFDDGNGRIARLLMNYVLLDHNLPPVVIKSLAKNNYLNALHQADTGDFSAFTTYIAEQLVSSLELTLKAAKGESIEEKDDWKKGIELWKKNLKTREAQVIKRTNELMIEAYANSIKPLFQALLHESCIFDDLFLDKFVYNGTHNYSYKVAGTDLFDAWIEILQQPSITPNRSAGVREFREATTEAAKKVAYFNRLIQQYPNVNFENINDLRFEIRYDAFKNNGRFPFSHKIELSVKFTELKILVEDDRHNRKQLLEKFYSEKIEAEEIDEIVKKLIMQAQEEMQKYIDDTKNRT